MFVHQWLRRPHRGRRRGLDRRDAAHQLRWRPAVPAQVTGRSLGRTPAEAEGEAKPAHLLPRSRRVGQVPISQKARSPIPLFYALTNTFYFSVKPLKLESWLPTVAETKVDFFAILRLDHLIPFEI